MVAEMEFCLLGPLLVRSGGAVVPARRGKQRAVLAALLLSGGKVVSLDADAGPVPRRPPSRGADDHEIRPLTSMIQGAGEVGY
jgi:hypothetical protein